MTGPLFTGVGTVQEIVQQVWAVSDDGIYAPFDEALHNVWLVAGPWIYLQPLAMGSGDRLLVDQVPAGVEGIGLC
jgi:hypothetical protein